MIPNKFAKAVEKIFKSETDDVDILPIWDVAEGKWKSFRISKSVFFITADELIKENAVAHNHASKSAEQTEAQKKKILEEFRKRVEELKRQAQQAKNNINGVNDEDQA
jgi:hypothetical protein